MTTNSAMDIAIGLMLMYLILSLACTVVNELIATVFGLRAVNLRQGIARLIDDAKLLRDFYNHGVISGAQAASGGGHPSYLSGQSFALALFGSLDPTTPLPGYSDVEDAVTHLPDSNIRDILLAQLTVADGKLEQLRDGVANWFDDAMDRVGGIYKRWLKAISIVVGILIAGALNADSFNVATSLWSDSTLRAQLVQGADQLVPRLAAPGAGERLLSSVLPRSTPDADAATKLRALKNLEDSLRPLPIGWDVAALQSALAGWSWRHWIEKLAGVLLTGLALSLGAPFWFDLLSKFIELRGTGVKPKRTDET